MSFELKDIKGLGVKSAEKLKAGGIESVEKLAQLSVEELSKVEGIGKGSAKKYIEGAKTLLNSSKEESISKIEEKDKKDKEQEAIAKEEKDVEEELKRLEKKREKLKEQSIKKGDFVLVKMTGRTEKGHIFQVSSPEDAKKAGIYDEKKDKQGFYTPEFVIVGKSGFVIEGINEILETMKFFEKKSVRIPPTKAFGKREAQKIDRMAIQRFKKLNEGKPPELGQTYVNKKGQRGTVTRIVQGRVIIDYNHPLAGQNLEYNLEVIDKIEEFDKKLARFIELRMPGAKADQFKIKFEPKKKSIEIEIPQMHQFNQGLLMFKFGLAMDLQNYLDGMIDTVKFLEVFEKPKIPETPTPEPEQNQNHKHEHDDNKSDESNKEKK